MSDAIPERPEPCSYPASVVIVASCYNERFTNALVEHCSDELTHVLPCASVEVLRVPGAFEIPVTVRAAIERSERRPDVVIALGVIIRGSTEHASLIGTAVTTSLLENAVQSGVPVIHEVLLLDDESQAYDRCIAPELNRGRESARTAASMVRLFSSRFPR
jgi:6,7-dimethyl-8-ribityllumazine synthase